MQLTSNEYEYARLASRDSQIPLDEMIEIMKKARDEFGISFRRYSRGKLFRFTEKSAIIRGNWMKRNEEKAQYYTERVKEITGMTEAEIKQEITCINDNPYAQIDMEQYAEKEFYKRDYKIIEPFLISLGRRQSLHTKLVPMIEDLYQKRLDYSHVETDLDAYYRATYDTILNSEIENSRELLEEAYPDLKDNEEELKRVTADLLVCRRLMGFLEFEYVMFDLRERPFRERQTFVSNSYRAEKTSQVNDRKKIEIFDNKILTYQYFKEFYGRELISVKNEEDYPAFEEFCRKYPKFVKKPAHGSQGTGVGLVTTDENTDLRVLFRDLLEDLGEYVCEELIVCHPKLRELNPDSVNTVRLTAYFDGEDIRILWPWMRAGHEGSFVDNAGSGGIVLTLDENGRIFTHGVDEAGRCFDYHPDNGVKFEGYQLPDWEGALEVAKAITRKMLSVIDDIRYVGWDLTYTEKNEWIILEGNASPQFVMQGPYNRGIRDELDAVIKPVIE